jgi:hypothetical protein
MPVRQVCLEHGISQKMDNVLEYETGKNHRFDFHASRHVTGLFRFKM